ncbi:MAG: glycosyltransferase family 4 protein [Myxococcota bacterium]
MRIAYVTTDPGVPAFGTKGASSHVQAMLRAFGRLGHEVVLFARPGGSAPLDLRFVERVDLPRLPGGRLVAAELERWRLRDNEAVAATLARAGTLHAVYERHALFAFAAMEHARAAGIPGLLEVNAPLVEEQARHRTLVDRGAAERAAARAFDAASALLAVSRPLADWLAPRTADPARIHVLANGVDLERFRTGARRAIARAAADARANDGAATQPFTIGFVGSLRPWHGLEPLADAFARVRDVAPRARLCIVGDGPGRAALEQRLAACGHAKAAYFVGAVPPEDVPRWLASFDAAVAPYPQLDDFYFSPLKLYEYMAAGLPVVASAIGQIREVIDDGVDGLLVPPGDVEATARALLRLERDAALGARLGAHARAKVADCDWVDVARRALALADAPADAARSVGRASTAASATARSTA